ncbi:hypothetical protein C8034_v004245 [Colletotrichum sidae]|uniref:AT hook domain-containing protein family protein n=1 Tax=Colletotrichum sidae TaxID=1347389 RepID=A0A4R8TNA8_9PEZI|nr:hypothetical protein C8034_v004245 [Colletotrichum sidae]
MDEAVGVAISPGRPRRRVNNLAGSAPAESQQVAPNGRRTLNNSTPKVGAAGGVYGIQRLPEELGPNVKLNNLTSRDVRLLLRKLHLLKENPIEVPKDMDRKGLASLFMATLVFAQEDAGTAVCISPNGILLTCSHCIAETADDLDHSRSHWLLFAAGWIVEAKTLAFDATRDLALLEIISAQGPSPRTFPFVSPAVASPLPKTRLVCLGHPGSEDLETSEPGLPTGYNVLHLSTGTFRGFAEGQDLQDNCEIGALMHTCRTYWGHSGAPLLERRTGTLIGLHSSWDEETGMRRGIALEAIQKFLKENREYLGEQDG